MKSLNSKLWFVRTIGLLATLAVPSLSLAGDPPSVAASGSESGKSVVAPSQKMTIADAKKIRKELESSGQWQHQVQVIPGGKSHKYTNAEGLSFELNVPSSAQGGKARDYLRAGGCGFLQLCVYLNPSDQRALISGAAAAIGVAICAAAPTACPFAAIALAVAQSYLRDHGICRAPKDELRVRIFPTIGRVGCV